MYLASGTGQQSAILSGGQVLELITNGTVLKIPLQIIRSRRFEASQEEMDQYKV
jgi:protein involved in temperature-dependent protein secretion